MLDETWVASNLVRRCGRALCGARLSDAVLPGPWKTTAFLAGLRRAGLTALRVVDGTIEDQIFLAYVPQHWTPTWRRDDLVIVDNLSSPKVAGVQTPLGGAGARLTYLPPDRPHFNPIEPVFAKFQWLLRSAAARSVDALWEAIGRLLERITPSACGNYFRHCGYNATAT